MSNRCRDVLGLHKCEEGNPMWERLQLEARMDANNAESQILVGNMHKASLLDHALEVILARKASYALDEILIRMPLSRQQLAHGWYHLEGVLIVKPLHRIVLQVAELQAHEASARL